MADEGGIQEPRETNRVWHKGLLNNQEKVAIETANEGSGKMIVDSLGKTYGSGPFRQYILRDCSFVLEEQKLTILIGPSGCGKSTLINILAGYEEADSGTATLDGAPVGEPNKDRLVVFQETALFPWMTTLGNVTYGPRVQRNRPKDEIETEALGLLEKVGLEEFRDKYPIQLSGGMQRRAELVRAMINNPRVMLLDEPFRGLDAMTRELMQEHYVRLFEERRQTTLFVTSEIDEAIFLADTLLIMTNGPGRIKKSIPIDMPWPRTPDMLTSMEYLRYKEEALDLLHEEALKAFAADNKIAADFLEAYEATKTESVSASR